LKLFKKILFYVALGVAVVVLSLTISVFLFKDKIINQFIREANKQLNTPVKVGKMEVSLWTSFPKISIVMKDVYVEDSHPGQYPLLTAGEISFQLSLIDVWREQYIVQGLRIRDSETYLKIDSKGENNYTIAKDNGTTSGGGSVSFELHQVSLQNTTVNYNDQAAEQQHTYKSSNLLASIQTIKDIYHIEASGELTTEKINVNNKSFLAGKSFQIDSKLV
jgi:hypothetical protein